MSELLAPAGDLEKLKYAAAYGADAVYFGMKDFSLRSYAGNFSLEDAEIGTKFLHKQNKKSYVTLNIYPNTSEYPKILELAKKLEGIFVDAFIVSDLGLIDLLIKETKVPIHISTQANTVNAGTALFYKKMGAKRVNLARELSFEGIEDIQTLVKGKIETEVFIHGALCFSYSGRCAISDYMTDRPANRGECTHPCRWKYYLMEETRPNQFYPVFEDSRGTYFFNNKDLALFPFVKKLEKIGVNSFKIEGRMKTIHYLSNVLSLYRKILDGEEISFEEGVNALSRVNNRGYSFGFMEGRKGEYNYENDVKQASSIFVGNVDRLENGVTYLRVRNRIFKGENLELLSPGGVISNFKMPELLITEKDETLDIAQNETILKINEKIPEYSILRRVL
jgi:putative protease